MSDEIETLTTENTRLTNEVEKWKALSRKNEERANANAEKAQRAGELETEITNLKADNERLTGELGEVTTSVAGLTGENLRLSVGIDKGLPKALIERLKGDDADTLSADADALLQYVPSDKRTPFPDPSQGPKGDTKTSNADQFASQLEGAGF